MMITQLNDCIHSQTFGNTATDTNTASECNIIAAAVRRLTNDT